MIKKSNYSPIAGSYKDPSGFLYRKDGVLYRQVNINYKREYDKLMSSGLYETLVKGRLMIAHEESPLSKKAASGCYKVLKPEEVSFISYPYEWCFSQLKDAALLTLKIQKIALEHGMILKDASAYNIQFLRGKPIFIDTLSFDIYTKGKPWDAYRQYCQHFLGPLALASSVDLRFLPLQSNYLDGFPLDFVSKLLPKKTFLNFGLATHIHIHARTQSHFAGKKVKNARGRTISKLALMRLVDNLRNTTRRCVLSKSKTEWGEYYADTNYSKKAFSHKKALIRKFIRHIAPAKKLTALDLGANNGEFSREILEFCKLAISTDYDPIAVEQNYFLVKRNNETDILPLLLDVVNPAIGAGWAGREREGFFERGKFDLVMALALVHHLAITFNVPLPRIAEFFSSTAQYAIVEFVPKSDSQVQRLLQSREDIFADYTQEGFESAFNKYFVVVKKSKIEESRRTLYLLKRA